MKRILFFLSFWVIMIQGIYATHIVKAPGSMTDVFTELPIQDIFDADTLFIEGGTGDIYLKAGPVDDGISYSWSIGANIYYTYSATFTYTDATATLPDGSKGSLVSIIRSNPDQSQYFYVVYRNLPLKPTTPSGSTSVCAGTGEGYSSTSTNATSYQWYLDPVEAGTISNETTSSPTITWSSSWTGDATITVKGIKDANESPISDPLTVTVGTVPTKPVITGDPFVKNGSSIIYTGSSVGAATWTWVMTPNTLATATPSGQNVTLNFTSTGTFDLTAQAHNTCGDGIVSDNFNVEIVDISGMQAEITQLVADTTSKGIYYRNIITGLNADKLALQNQVNSLVADTTSKGIAYRDAIAGLNADKLALQTQVDALVADTTSKGIAYRDAIAILNTEKLALQTQVNDLVSDTTQYGIDYRAKVDELNDALAANAPLIAQVNELVSDTTQYGIDYRAKVDELNDALAANAPLIAQVNELVSDTTQYGIDYRAKVDELNDALAANAPLIAQVNDLVSDTTQYGIDYRAKVDELNDALAANAALQIQIGNLTTQLNDAVAANADLVQQVIDLENSNIALTTQLATAISERDAALEHISNIATLLGVDEADIEDQITLLQQIYILSWEVTEVITSVFETEIGTFSVSLYPNPSPGQIFIECTEEIKEVKIYTLQGSLIKDFAVNATETSFVVNRGEMPVGTYIVHIETTKGTSTHKVIFQ